MDELELADIFPGLDDEALSSLNIDQPWYSDIFDNISAEDIDDALLTDVTSKPVTKPELIEVDIFGNDLIVGDEVEVNNSEEHFNPSSDNPPKAELFPDQDEYTHTLSTDASPETIHLTPEIESSCSTPSNHDSCSGSPQLNSNGKKHQLKRCKFEDILLEEVPTVKKRAYDFSPPIVPCEPNPNAFNRVHYVFQKGQTLILQTEKPSNRQAANAQPRIKPLSSHSTSNQSIYRVDNNEYIRIKPLATHPVQTGGYTITPSSSQTGSDTDIGAESPVEAIEPRARFSVFSTRNGTSVTTTSTIRLTPGNGGVYTTNNRYNNQSSHVNRQNNDSYYGADFNGEYSSGYTTGNSTPAYRQQQVFQNSTGILVLTEEEKRTLLAEGYSIPTRLPLSKQDERNLKKIRRKIKNKISAQESRRKKKEYVETLEKKVENYAQENARLKGQVENLEMHNRTILSQLRQLRHLVDKTASNAASSQAISSSSPSKNSTTGNSKKTSNNSSNFNTNVATNSSAYLMVFLACFAALFAGQPDYPSSSSNSNSQLLASSSPKGHIVGDLSTFGSLHQIGYTWSATTQKMKPRLDGDYARCPNVSYMRDHPTGTASIYKMHEWVRTAAYLKGERASQSSERTVVKKPVSHSRILGSSKEYNECEPMTWWEYIFGLSGTECRDDKEVTVSKLEADLFSEAILLANQTVTNYTASHTAFGIPVPNQNSLPRLDNDIVVSA
nr:cAMP responsive element binding protein 3 [Hymenolepis microstoma]